jgi:tetratricopeptide (TPR) repeat protein
MLRYRTPTPILNLDLATQNMDQRYTLGEVERITGTSRRQLEQWSRLGLVHPENRWGERFFNFSDLVTVETLSRLAAQQVPAHRLRRAIDALERNLGQTRAKLSSLRISTNGSEVVVHEPGAAGGLIEPLTGQFVLDFEISTLDRKVRAMHERTAEQWFEMGMAWDANPDTFDDAIHAYRQAITAAPEWVEAYINLGTALFHVGRIGESRDVFAAAVERDPQNPLARFNLGCAHERLGDPVSAIDNFRAALAISPRMPDAHLNLALAYERTGVAPEALDHFELYLRYDPQGAWAEFARARIRASKQPAAGSKVTPFRGVPR